MDELPKSPPRPAAKPDKPTGEDLTKATPEKVRHVRFNVVQNTKTDILSSKSRAALEAGTSVYAQNNGLYEPHMNSTYMLQAKIDKLAKERELLQRQTASNVQSIEMYQSEVNEKASLSLNFKKGSKKYSNLISLDVEPEDIAAMANKPKISRPVKPRTELDASDIMAFFTPDLVTETPDLDLDTGTLEEETVEPPEFSFDFLFQLYKSREKPPFNQ